MIFLSYLVTITIAFVAPIHSYKYRTLLLFNSSLFQNLFVCVQKFKNSAHIKGVQNLFPVNITPRPTFFDLKFCSTVNSGRKLIVSNFSLDGLSSDQGRT